MEQGRDYALRPDPSLGLTVPGHVTFPRVRSLQSWMACTAQTGRELWLSWPADVIRKGTRQTRFSHHPQTCVNIASVLM